MAEFLEIVKSDISVASESFIYALISVSSGDSVARLATISSDDSLTFFRLDTGRSNAMTIVVEDVIRPVQDGVTCIKGMDQIIVTAGRDGKVKLWDSRQHKQTGSTVQTPNSQGISSLACHHERNLIVAGTSYEEEGLGQVGVYVWGFENKASPQLVRSYTESHTDTVTQVHFITYPGLPLALLTASTDGLINIFDPEIEDEDDAVLEVFNNHGAINHACPTTQGVWTITHDEQMSYHTFTGEASQGEEKLELREKFGCDYAVKLSHHEGKMVLIVGANKEETTDKPFVAAYTFSAHATAPVEFRHVCYLSGAHGEEIIRDVLDDNIHKLIISCGEDGLVRLWGAAALPRDLDDMEAEIDGGGVLLSTKEKRKKKLPPEANRFQPY